MGTQTNSFTDGCAGPPSFLYNPPAPEEMFPPLVGEDLSWVAGVGGAIGMQPITSTNLDGDYDGVSPMSPALAEMMNWPEGNKP
jgi:hypothetical protein